MRDYAILGGCLRSALEFPGLREVANVSPTWTLRLASPAPLPPDAHLLGTDDVDVGVRVRLFRSERGLHLAYDDTGCFDVSCDARDILWRAPRDVSLDAARLDVIGRVLAVALHVRGAVCLHASAVALGNGVIAFLGAKGFGKSTIAGALTRAGARLVTDDTLRVEPGYPPIAFPGVHELRLRSDAAMRLQPLLRDARILGDRHVIRDLGADQIEVAPGPLSAIYLLSPAPSLDGGVATRLAPLAPVPAALSLVRNAKLAPLLGGGDAVTLLDRIITVASAVPVQLLQVARDFSRLDDVVADVLEWHEVTAGAPAA
jgi:hypothetical protein